MSAQLRLLSAACAAGEQRGFGLVGLASDPLFGELAGGTVPSIDTVYRDLMRMEMPDRYEDLYGSKKRPVPDAQIDLLPIVLPHVNVRMPPPQLVKLYRSYYTRNFLRPPIAGKECAQAAMLYMVVALGSPEAMEQFSPSEIGDTDNDGMLEFLDGWGRPIFWLRWAPGFSGYSDIQKADPTYHHCPFDPQRQDSYAYHLIPLIYSSGPDGEPGGLQIKSEFSFNTTGGNIFADSNFLEIGTPVSGYQDNISNATLEAKRLSGFRPPGGTSGLPNAASGECLTQRRKDAKKEYFRVLK